ncbi:hypothetical protein BBD42_18665 [Paenibacillus sp. BIHB 4019]|uniref:Uncharacterized protein n=1 Tax=Paenibacillus sp. BIHB 4019 TaxID=1870819 RepID=A0A1B2DKN7_9BACL|nr:hypothetical protein [Paenibacillus sp. BIHB 4019]ANY68272.1 hypothetical protein BBD42_18665 [Paenibacillus sp. BIHB 4019]
MAEEKLRDQLTKVMAERRKRSGEGAAEAEVGQAQAHVLGVTSSEAGSTASIAAGDDAPDEARNEASRAEEHGALNFIPSSTDQLTALPEAVSAEQSNEEWKAFYEAVSTYVAKMRD